MLTVLLFKTRDFNNLAAEIDAIVELTLVPCLSDEGFIAQHQLVKQSRVVAAVSEADRTKGGKG